MHIRCRICHRLVRTRIISWDRPSYAAKLARRDNRIFALLSDGECNEGSVWEAAMLASAQKLDRLVAIIDYNKWRADRRMVALEPLAKWRAFGWHTIEVDGHDYDQLSEALSAFPRRRKADRCSRSYR